VAGLWRDGKLIIVGRTTALSTLQSRTLATLLRPAAEEHPWPDSIGTGFGGDGTRVALTKVVPELVVEVTADAAMYRGRYRHPLRYVRPRTDMTTDDLGGP
jgi:hypothetical protein